MSDVIELGEHRLPGEVVAVRGDVTTVQAYDYTGGLAPGHPARSLAEPLSVVLGPHLLGGIFDGLLRPLDGAPAWLEPGVIRPYSADREFAFTPAVTDGTIVAARHHAGHGADGRRCRLPHPGAARAERAGSRHSPRRPRSLSCGRRNGRRDTGAPDVSLAGPPVPAVP